MKLQPIKDGMFCCLRPNHECPDRDYTVSSDPVEWQHVENLLAPDLVPEVPVKDRYPSGFVRPTARHGDHPYFVRRTTSHLMPVYARRMANADQGARTFVVTVVRRADGDLFKLRDDLADFLRQRYDREFMSQVGEVYGRVLFRGDFEEDFKEFLLEKGF